MGTACETWARICIQIPLWINKCTNKETNAKCSWGHALDSQICFHAQQFYTEGSQVQHVIALFLPKGSTTFYVISSTIFCGCFTHNCLLVFSKPIYFYFLSSSCFFYRCSSSSLSPNVIKLFFLSPKLNLQGYWRNTFLSISISFLNCTTACVWCSLELSIVRGVVGLSCLITAINAVQCPSWMLWGFLFSQS